MLAEQRAEGLEFETRPAARPRRARPWQLAAVALALALAWRLQNWEDCSTAAAMTESGQRAELLQARVGTSEDQAPHCVRWEAKDHVPVVHASSCLLALQGSEGRSALLQDLWRRDISGNINLLQLQLDYQKALPREALIRPGHAGVVRCLLEQGEYLRHSLSRLNSTLVTTFAKAAEQRLKQVVRRRNRLGVQRSVTASAVAGVVDRVDLATSSNS